MTSNTSAAAVSSASTTTVPRNNNSGRIRATVAFASGYGSSPVATHTAPTRASAIATRSSTCSRRSAATAFPTVADDRTPAAPRSAPRQRARHNGRVASGVEPGRADRPIDFFISYSPADERWATWLAWEFEAAGYRTMLQAWDFVPGTNFIDFMDRGVREAAFVIAVLSERYLRSTYGRLEWQAALRADPDGSGNRLITVRIEDCALDGLLATITYVDLGGVTDAYQARTRVLDPIRQAQAGRARPSSHPGVPGDRPAAAETRHPAIERRPRSRRTPINPPPFPPMAGPAARTRDSASLLHVAGPRFGRGITAPR